MLVGDLVCYGISKIAFDGVVRLAGLNEPESPKAEKVVGQGKGLGGQGVNGGEEGEEG